MQAKLQSGSKHSRWCIHWPPLSKELWFDHQRFTGLTNYHLTVRPTRPFNAKHDLTRFFFFFSLSTTSLQSGPALLHGRCPYRSVQVPVLHLFYIRTPQFRINIIQPPLSTASFFLPPPGFLSSNFFTVLAPPILTCPSHSNPRNLITVTMFAYRNLL